MLLQKLLRERGNFCFLISNCTMRLLSAASAALLNSVVIMLLTILLTGLLLKKVHQPYFVAYIIAGIVLGPGVSRLFTDTATIASIGELGLLIQMFFIGAKTEIQSFAQQLKKPVTGVLVQLILSVTATFVFGHFYGWSAKESLFFGFAISLSSSAIILDYLEKYGELNKPMGRLTSGILILQDFLLMPMILVINFMGLKQLPVFIILSLIFALVLFSMLLRNIFSSKPINLPLPEWIKKDHELQVFAGLLLCFGCAWLAEIINLSAAMGALTAGIFIARTADMQWLESHLLPFRIFFLALFFVGIGLQINPGFFIQHALLIILLVLAILVINSIINTLVFRLLGESWHNSMYAGALLSQIGEFSLVLCIVAKNQGLIDAYWYQLTLAVISATMLLTALWINIIKKFVYRMPLL